MHAVTFWMQVYKLQCTCIIIIIIIIIIVIIIIIPSLRSLFPSVGRIAWKTALSAAALLIREYNSFSSAHSPQMTIFQSSKLLCESSALQRCHQHCKHTQQ